MPEPANATSEDGKRKKPSFIKREYKPDDELYAQIFKWEEHGFALIPSPRNPHKCASILRRNIRPEPARGIKPEDMVGRWVKFRFRQHNVEGKFERIKMAYLTEEPPSSVPHSNILTRIVPKHLRSKEEAKVNK